MSDANKTEARPDDPIWRLYEKAVARFLTAAGPTAKVTHNHYQTDPDTGSLRQRDVWIEYILCDLYPLKALVSCKHWKNKLDALRHRTFLR